MTKIKNAVCPGCTLLCDDIELSQNNNIDSPEFKAKNACSIGHSFFQIQSNQQSSHYVAGSPVELVSAVESAVEILKNAKAPLICGLDQMTTEAQQTGWKLADCLGATIDTTMTNHGRSSMFSLQRVGKVTATIGEIASRADLIVFWFCNPNESHPRLLERLGTSEKDVEIIVINDVIPEMENSPGRESIKIDRGAAPILLAVCRAIIDAKNYDRELAESTTGLRHAKLEQVASRLKQSKYGAIFFGQTTEDSSFDLANDSLASMIRLLNNHTRFVGMKLRSDSNAQSGENVLAWSSGYPFAVNHHHSFPRYNQLEYSAEMLLLREECDAILFATGADLQNTFAGLSRTAKDNLASIPKISLCPIPNFPSDVAFEVGVPGMTEAGEYCRNDGVPLPVGAVSSSELASADEVLVKILNEFNLVHG